MLFAWDGTVDLTGAMTLALAGVTAYLARATQRAVSIADDERAASIRPVLVPVGAITPDGLTVANVGQGPALNTTATYVHLGDADPKEYDLHGTAAPIAPGTPLPVNLGFGGSAIDVVTWTYEDLAGRRYRTRAERDYPNGWTHVTTTPVTDTTGSRRARFPGRRRAEPRE